MKKPIRYGGLDYSVRGNLKKIDKADYAHTIGERFESHRIVEFNRYRGEIGMYGDSMNDRISDVLGITLRKPGVNACIGELHRHPSFVIAERVLCPELCGHGRVKTKK